MFERPPTEKFRTPEPEPEDELEENLPEKETHVPPEAFNKDGNVVGIDTENA